MSGFNQFLHYLSNSVHETTYLYQKYNICPAPRGEIKSKFRLSDDFHDPGLIKKLETFFRANDIEVAAAEFVEDIEGNRYIYDLNMNTNYNQQAERDSGSGKRAMHHLSEFLGKELAAISESAEYTNQIPVIDPG